MINYRERLANEIRRETVWLTKLQKKYAETPLRELELAIHGVMGGITAFKIALKYFDEEQPELDLKVTR